MAVNKLEIRMARLEGAYEQINHRLGAIEQDIRGLREDVGGLRAEHGTAMGGLRSRMDRQFFWMLGLIVISILMPFARSIEH